MRGQDGLEYETDQPALGEQLHTPFYQRDRGDALVILVGNPVIYREDAGGVRWRVEARIRFHGGESTYTEYHPKLQRAQESVRMLALNADRIEQEWDQVQPGRLPQ